MSSVTNALEAFRITSPGQPSAPTLHPSVAATPELDTHIDYSANITPAKTDMETSSSPSPAAQTSNLTYEPDPSFDPSVAFADLGLHRADQEVAAAGERDFALQYGQPGVHVQAQLPRGTDAHAFAWHTFQYTTTDRDQNAELKDDLHSGQLHRQNRAAVQAQMQMQMHSAHDRSGPGLGPLGYGMESPPRVRGRSGREGRGSRGARGGRGAGRNETPNLIAAVKPDYQSAPLAVGVPEEVSADVFFDGPLDAKA
ncbi:hypothetical protein P154DRAFT_527346 [Amniculicola lignicola CBS 123094]|uniref:Uncharacterized protein n=1 Tax=Amniculicola lignicola CBS 123094 TaxID=1392246 RepID=A0A6A5VYF7_9PLEO|nr:hypothetical protein P154DRAFT_527346 [Amniculicola lignicola CBS 123094]